jgi:non-homologous end joining protein Ku
MAINFIYPAIIDEIKFACLQHISDQVSANDLQRTIQRGEAMIVALEEKDIRDILTDIEGKLELIKFTVDDENQLPETQKIAQDLFAWLFERNS